MKSSRKILIEKYVNLRCVKLQEDARLEEWGFDDIKSAASGVVNKAKDFGSKAIDTAKDFGSKVKDAGSRVNQSMIDSHNKVHDLATNLGANSDIANLAYITPAAPFKTAYDAYDIGRAGYEKGLGAAADKTAEKIGGGMDAFQSGLDMAGLIPGYGAIADLANVGISGTRGAIELARGNTDAAKKHGIGAGVSTLAAIPGAGDLLNVGKLGFKWAPPAYKAISAIGKSPIFKMGKYANKVQKQDNRYNQNQATDAVADAASNVADTVSTNLAGWGQDGPFSTLYNYFTGD